MKWKTSFKICFFKCNLDRYGAGFSGAKEKGVWRLEGKEYLVKEGDILVFKFNV
jgi:ribosome-binding ATPase YchF (GTP1/OBG family)